jgi:hypothetical protein
VLADVSGKILDQQQLYYSSQELSWSDIRQGIYLLQIYDEEGELYNVYKVVKI